LILDKLRGCRFDSILDVGCGNGSLLGRLKEYATNLYGIEKNPNNCDVARQYGTIYEGDFRRLRQIIPKQQFDLEIFCGSVAHQIVSEEDAKATFDASLEYLAPKGHVILASHSGSHIDAVYLRKSGLKVLNMSVPMNLFCDTRDVGTREMYIARNE
jgi:predicted TPR repeat methyltransferase